MNLYGMEVRIVKDNLTEEEAYTEEYNTIMNYINNGYGIDIDGLRGDDKNKFLTNQTFGSRGSIGISNPMYGVTPSERMDEQQYKIWLNKTQERLKSQTGSNNPNWNNTTLHDKVKDNLELRIQYYSRPGSQNGRSKRIELYDINNNYIDTFDYIGACAEYVKNVTCAKGTIDSIRSNIKFFTNKGKPYLGFRYKIL